MYTFAELYPRAIVQINSRYFVLAGIVFLIFYVLFKNKFAAQKIQKAFPKIYDYRRDIFFSLISMTIFATMAVLVLTTLRPYTQLYKNIADYGWFYYGFSMMLMMFIHDTYFYWVHRFMHLPKVYRYVHLIHHKSTNPSPWTSYAFHPLEAVIEAFIIVLITFILPCHFSAVILFFLFQTIYNVYGHSGFEFYPKNMHLHPVGKWLNTSVSHNQHHQFVNGNYGLYFTFWDRWMGTFREDYNAHYEKAVAHKTVTSAKK